MNKIDDSQLHEWNRRGLIPGPEETEDAYLERVNYCLSPAEDLGEKIGDEAPFTRKDAASLEQEGNALAKARECYDIRPDWIPLYFSNFRLPFWHGGCAWIFQEDPKKPMGALLQLRKIFASRDTFLKIYHKDEVLTHEIAHASRMAFEEPCFEEFLAYRSSPSPLRRWLGPVIKASWESLLFVASLLFVMGLDLAALFWDLEHIGWAKALPIGLLALGLGRLWFRHRQLNRCFANLNASIKDRQKAEAVLFRLTDEEIITFSRISPLDIQHHQSVSLRWRIIKQAYFD